MQEIPIKPLVVRVPEHTVERYFVERERHTDALPTINVEVPPTPAPHVTVNIPERSKDENQRVRTTDSPVVDQPAQKEKAPSNEEKQFDPVNKKRSGDEQKTVPPTNEINSSTIPGSDKNNSGLELFGTPEPASQANVPAYKKKGRAGRQRKYDELGIDDVEPVREVILLMHHTGQTWPGMSKDMQNYYQRFYFTKPNKRKDGKDYERHLKCWERKERWTATAPV